MNQHSQKSQNSGYWWPGTYLVPGHFQPTWRWSRQVGSFQVCMPQRNAVPRCRGLVWCDLCVSNLIFRVLHAWIEILSFLCFFHLLFINFTKDWIRRTWAKWRDIFKCIVMNVKFCIFIQISLKFVPEDPTIMQHCFDHEMAWHRTGDKPLPEPMLI